MMSEKKAAISVSFVSRGAGTCQWCGKQKESGIYDATTSDGSFVGMYCMKDLQRAIDNKTPERKPTQATIPMAQQAAK
jgi:hypothetical protein